MLNYVVRRLLLGLVTLAIITFIVYGLIRAMPGDPLVVAQTEFNLRFQFDRAAHERMREIYGLNQPWYRAYFVWMSNVVRGDLGNSISHKQSVTSMIGERIGPTLFLSGTSLILTYLLAIPLGLYMTARNGRWDERANSTVLYMLYSFPTFVAALFLQIIFAVKLQGTFFALPLCFMTSDNYSDLSAWGKTWDVFKHALMPVACETYGMLAYYSRFIHSNLQEVIRQDYIRTARAKGVGPWRVLWHHAFRNTLIPLVTSLGLSLPAVLSGAVILEQIFSWPGMGNLFFEALRERDYPTIMGLTLMFSVTALVGQLIADVLYSVVDPRVTLR